MRNFTITDDVRDYATSHGTWPKDELVERLRSKTQALGEVAGMQIGDDQGQLLTMMAKLINARLAVEVGTFTGLSSLCIARGMAEGSSLLCCDVSEEWTAIAREAWDEAGLGERIVLKIGPAIRTLNALPQESVIDLVFIDADKTGYLDYWEELVPRVRSGGVLLVDNVLWSGRVVDGESTDESTVALRVFNETVANDERVEVMVLTAFDGLTIARKR